MSDEQSKENITVGEVVKCAEYIHRNQEAKTWLFRGVSMFISMVVFVLSSWVKGHLLWLESEVPLIIRLAQTLAGGSFVFTMAKGSFFFLSHRKAAGVVDARKRQLPDHIKIAKQDDGTFWIINVISGRSLPVRSDNDYHGLVQTVMSMPLYPDKPVISTSQSISQGERLSDGTKAPD